MTKPSERRAQLLAELRSLKERAEEIERELGTGTGEPLSPAAASRMAVALSRIAQVGVFRAEAELEAHHQELEVLYASAPVGLCFVDSSLRFRTVNARLAEIDGVAIDEHVGRRIGDVVPALAEQIVPVYERILRTGEDAVNLEVRVVVPSDPRGERTWLVNHHPVREPGGTVAGIVTVVQDISERKHTEREQARRRAHLEAAQRLVRMGSWQWDRVRDEFEWSDEMYRVYDRDRSFRPTFDAFFEQVHPLDRTKMRLLLDRVVETGEPAIADFRVMLRDGSVRWVRSTCAAQRNADGELTQLVGTAEQIEEPHQVERPEPARERGSGSR